MTYRHVAGKHRHLALIEDLSNQAISLDAME